MDTSTLTTTVATILAARTTTMVWRPDGPDYADAETGIYYGRLAPTPDRGVGITTYAATDDLETFLAVRRIQLRFRGPRGDRAGADDIADAAFAVLQGLARVAGLNLVSRVSTAHLGADENDRQERTDSYQITIDNTEA